MNNNKDDNINSYRLEVCQAHSWDDANKMGKKIKSVKKYNSKWKLIISFLHSYSNPFFFVSIALESQHSFSLFFFFSLFFLRILVPSKKPKVDLLAPINSPALENDTKNIVAFFSSFRLIFSRGSSPHQKRYLIFFLLVFFFFFFENLAASGSLLLHGLRWSNVDLSGIASGWGGRADAVLDLCGHGHEGLFNVSRVLGRRFQERDSKLVGVLLEKIVKIDS